MIIQKIKSIIIGIFASAGLLFVYLVLLTSLNSWAHALDQFRVYALWMTLIILGFGAQMGLHSYLKQSLKSRVLKGEIAATGTVSTGAMIACCAHHITDILPFLGVSAAAVFLSQYQFAFILIGVISNFIGLGFILHIGQKHGAWTLKIPKEVQAMDKNTMLVITAVAVTVLVLTWSLLSFTPASAFEHTDENYEKFVSAETTDPCATPEGYTDASWREHMGHHPDRYAECL